MNDHDPSARDDELVSAYLDGEATDDERTVVEASAELRARVAEFADVQHRVGAEVPVDADLREVHIAAALAEAGHPQVITPLAKARDRRRVARLALSAAAAVAVIGLAVPVLRNLATTDDDTAGPPLSTTADSVGAAGGGTGADSAAAGADSATGDDGARMSELAAESTSDGDLAADEMDTSPGATGTEASLYGAVTDLGSFEGVDPFVDAVRDALADDSSVDDRATKENVDCALEAISLVGDLDLVGAAVVDGRSVIFAVGHGNDAGRQLVALDTTDCGPLLDAPLPLD